MTIDAHAHFIPADFPDRPGFPRMERGDGDPLLVFGTTRYRAEPVWFQAERRIEAMDRAGVDEEIVSPMPPLLAFGADPATARDLFRHVNERLAELVAAGRGRIHGLGVVPMQDPELAVAELAGLAGLGLRGIEVGSHIAGVGIGDPRFAPVLAEVDRLGLSVFVHTLPRADEAALAASLRGSIGVGIEGARGGASLLFGESARHCARDRVLFSHAAGGLPLMLARADHFWRQQAPQDRAAAAPSEVARRFLYDSMLFDPRGLRFVVDYLGSDRVVLGTDFPAMRRPERLATLLDGLGLDPEAEAAIADENARRFLGLVDEARVPAGTEAARG